MPMNDKERLTAVIEKLQSHSGIDEGIYQRIINELNAANNNFGYDKDGKYKIIFFDAQPYDIRSFNSVISENYSEKFTPHYISAPLNLDTVVAAEGFQVICIFVNDFCDQQVIEKLARIGVRLIALRCAGFNNVDLNACKDQNIDVVRVPAYSPYAVAEHTAGLMLMLNRKIHQAYLRNRTGYFLLAGLTGFDMKGKTVGIIGTGKIGQCLVNIMLGFGCRVLAYDKYPNKDLTERENVDYVSLDQLYKEADIISLHVPLFPETHYLINKDAIKKMKPGVMLINTSRGGLVDTRALIQGLKSGHIGAAGLDVYEEEAGIFFRDHSDKVLTDDVLARLLTFNNVVITSHQAFLTREALKNIATTTLANISEFEQGKRGRELTNFVQLK